MLINPNVATIQTDTRFADQVYLLPVTPEYVESIIEKERPDGVMLAYGGQTALNCGVRLSESGVLQKYGVGVLGTQIKGIQRTEDRQLFKDSMTEVGMPVLNGKTVTNFADAKVAAEELSYPVIIRVAYTLGGRGGGIAHNEIELYEIVERGLKASLVGQVLIEEYIGNWKQSYPVIIRVAYTLGGRGGGIAHNEIELYEIVERGLKASLVGQVLIEEYIGNWKQIEYEVMQDYDGNNIVVCNMENVLSMRVHTGDNIVVAPSQTIDNHEYHMLRTAALRATKHVGIVGECNIQYALAPDSDRYVAIEINPRLSRSSALASKATGYPLAYMSAKIGLGYNLSELVNHITKSTTACFEPSLDYIVCKHPRWDFSKFELANRRLGPTMKSVGEVMAVGRTFEESLQKAIRMLDIGNDGLVLNRETGATYDEEGIEERLSHHNDYILYHVAVALKMGITVERIYHLSAIDPWFIEKIRNIVSVEESLKSSELDAAALWKAKRTGFSDRQIARAKEITPDSVRELRKELGVLPSVKQIDTLAAEWPAVTNYLYMTYGGGESDIRVSPDEKAIVVIGAGPYRIGSSVEFDWGTVNMVWGLQENGEKNVSVVNCNPETVSTDYDICTRLYFEELTQERILDITEFENPKGVITCVGGQTANNLTLGLAQHGVPILGTGAQDVDMAENRSRFSGELDKLHIQQPRWQEFLSLNEARAFAQDVGFPVIVRPSYVLSGAAMKVVWSQGELKRYVKEATDVSPDHPVVISKFMLNSLEVDVDGVCDGKNVVIGAIVEHIDSAGVHSGDAMMCIPPWRLSNKTIETINEYSRKIALTFNVRGPFNLQFLIHDDHVYVIELNIRASRSMPFVSKLVRTNLISLASRAILGRQLPAVPENKWQNISRHGIKVPQFSFMQLDGADITLGVEMQSTGEAACFGSSFYDALAKGLTSVGYNLPKSGAALVTVGGAQNRKKLISTIAKLRVLGFRILATEHTAEFLKGRIGDVETVHKISEPARKPNISDLLYERTIDFIINIPSTATLEKYVGMLEDEYQIRRKSLELGIPVLTTIELAESFVNTLEWLKTNKTTREPIEPYDTFD